jgi:hypothetical protein
MSRQKPTVSRREFVQGSLAIGGLLLAAPPLLADQTNKDLAADKDKALIAITLDLEMSRNFPVWTDTHWDFEKGNLDTRTKNYAVEAARRVKARGGVVHFFLVGRALEQESVDWLKGIVEAGHPVGNHTYDHVNVLATRLEDTQFRFRRAPWLIAGQTTSGVIAENIRLTTAAMKSRLGFTPAGFRTPGGFNEGLEGRADIQRLLLDQGFTWVSSKYPAHPVGRPGQEPTGEIMNGILKAQAAAQPFAYPTGLIEVPMSPISDVTAFRTGRWQPQWFKKAIRQAVELAIEHRGVFDFLAHPSCLYVTDPGFETIELICDMVGQAKGKAAIVDLGTIARRAKLNQNHGS